MKRIISLLVVVVAMTMAVGAQAQGLYGSRTGTGVLGQVIPAWNTTDSLIYDGQVVMIDTTSTIKRFGVKRYDGSHASRPRVIGLAVGNIPRSSSGGNGTVLIWGYHPGAHATKALAAGALLELSTLNGSLAISDSMSQNVARVITGVAGATTTSNAKYGVWWFGSTGGKGHP